MGFVNCLPSSVVLALWDSIMTNGLWLLIPTAIAVLQTFEEALLDMGFDEMLEFFKSLRRTREAGANIGKLHADLFMERVHGIDVPPVLLNYLQEPLKAGTLVEENVPIVEVNHEEAVDYQLSKQELHACAALATVGPCLLTASLIGSTPTPKPSGTFTC